MENDQKELIAIRKIIRWQMYIDYRKLNEATWKDHFPLLFIDQILEKLVGHEYYYCLVGTSPKTRKKLLSPAHLGHFHIEGCLFGLFNALATFQRCMIALFSDLLEECMEIFMDDLSVFGPSFEKFLSNLNTRKDVRTPT
ncbi:Retrovirus-related Pol polyprotein from transposon 17.6, partial [Mucuna pruriens]